MLDDLRRFPGEKLAMIIRKVIFGATDQFPSVAQPHASLLPLP
jgi:hypothetical protein